MLVWLCHFVVVPAACVTSDITFSPHNVCPIYIFLVLQVNLNPIIALLRPYFQIIYVDLVLIELQSILHLYQQGEIKNANATNKLHLKPFPSFALFYDSPNHTFFFLQRYNLSSR